MAFLSDHKTRGNKSVHRDPRDACAFHRIMLDPQAPRATKEHHMKIKRK